LESKIEIDKKDTVKMSFAIFFDDGGVLNDNNIRGPQWEVFCGEYLHSKFGGDSEVWSEANHKVSMTLAKSFWSNSKVIFQDFNTFYANYKSEWVKQMFEEVGRSVPPKKDRERIFDATVVYVWPRIHSAIPGIIECVKELYSNGYILYTATGLHSKEIKMVLEGMSIKQFFSEFFGPDLINTRKRNPKFFELIFKKLNIESNKAIVIEDRPKCIENAIKSGAQVIQACVTGEYAPQFPLYVENMYELPHIIENLIKALDL
jgi:HAD superfamily hydrolase (TIGR01509 family)